jgi:AraC-like DNA-binding protein
MEGLGHEWHHHSSMELTLFSQGSGTRFVGDSIHHFTALDLVLIGPALPHYWHVPGPCAGFAIQFDFNPEHPFWRFPETNGVSMLWKKALRGLHFSGPSTTKIAALLQDSLYCGGFGRLTRFMRIIEILAKAEQKESRLLSSETFAPPLRLSTYQGLQKVIALVFNHFQDELCLEDALGEAHMSKASFERHFRKHTGKTFTRFLTEVRLNFAGRHLVETNLPVGEIALISGYNNISYFNNQFHKFYQLSPCAFRKQMQIPLSRQDKQKPAP